MNKILSILVATFVAVPFSAVVFAADVGKPVVPAPPVVADTAPAVTHHVNTKADKLNERNQAAKATTKSLKGDVASPVSATSPVILAPPAGKAGKAGKAGAVKNKSKLNQRNIKAQETTKTLKSTTP